MEVETHIDWKELCVALQEQITKLLEKIAILEAENRELRERLNSNSGNSSKPPSQDPFRKTRTHQSTGRKPGGQPGHPVHKRPMVPPEQLTKTVELKAAACPDCGVNTLETIPLSVECRQTIELPVIQPEVTQYNIYTCRCGKCGKHVRPDIPKEAEKGFGPRLMGFVTMLAGEIGTSKRKICAVAFHLGIKISLGALCNIHRIASDILERPFEAIRSAVLAQQNINADESSWRINNKRCWIWIGATPTATFFQIDPSRSQKAFQSIFGGFQHILSCDRYGAYNPHAGKKQICLAHIKRDFIKMSERKGADGALGRILCGELTALFALWKSFKSQEMTRKELQQRAELHIDHIRDALTIAASANGIENKSVALSCDLLERFPTLWTFLYEECVEPTNNLAERGLRPAVIWRKITGGSQSSWGLKFTERLLTITCTLRQCAMNLFDFLARSFQAHLHGAPEPPVIA